MQADRIDDIIDNQPDSIDEIEAEEPENDIEDAELDGTDSSIIPDEDADASEADHSGIFITYIMNQKEIRSVLKISPAFRYSWTKMLIQTILFSVLFIFFLATGLTASTPRSEPFIIASVCAIMIALVWLWPEFQLRSISKKQTTGEVVEAEIFPDVIKMGKGDGYWEIPLDGTSCFQEKNELLILTTPDKKCVAFPLRSIEPALRSDVIAMLTAGTVTEKQF